MGVIARTASGWARGSPATMLFAAGGRRTWSPSGDRRRRGDWWASDGHVGGRICESAGTGTWSERRPAATAQHARDDEGITVPSTEGDSTQLIPGLAIHAPEG